MLTLSPKQLFVVVVMRRVYATCVQRNRFAVNANKKHFHMPHFRLQLVDCMCVSDVCVLRNVYKLWLHLLRLHLDSETLLGYPFWPKRKAKLPAN